MIQQEGQREAPAAAPAGGPAGGQARSPVKATRKDSGGSESNFISVFLHKQGKQAEPPFSLMKLGEAPHIRQDEIFTCF